MKSCDQKQLKSRMTAEGTEAEKFAQVSSINVKVVQVTPYVINIKDLESTKFKQAKKRVLISGFDVDLALGTYICRHGNSEPNELISSDKFRTKSAIAGTLTPISA